MPTAVSWFAHENAPAHAGGDAVTGDEWQMAATGCTCHSSPVTDFVGNKTGARTARPRRSLNFGVPGKLSALQKFKAFLQKT
jgi:hypothetical protein